LALTGVFFGLVVVLPDFAADFFRAGFFFVDAAAGAAAFLSAAGVVTVLVVSFASSLIPGQSRQIKTTAIR
jgi:hypothetical protein